MSVRGCTFRLLSRETSGRAFVPQIDGLRFFAIAAVLAFHFAPEYQDALKLHHDPLAAQVGTSAVYAASDAGQVGVSLFFVISGLVLALPFARHHLTGGQRVDLRSYFVRRVTRIEPPYVICLCLLFLIQAIATHWHAVLDHLRHLGYSLAYLHNARYHQRSTVNGVAWSLEVEVQFYILAPLLALAYRLRPTWLRRTLVAAGIVAVAIARPHMHDDYHGLNLAYQLHYFLAGFLLADLYLLDWDRPASRPWAWDVTAVAGWVALAAVMLGLNYRQQQYLLPWLILVIDVAAFRGRCWPWVVCQPAVYLIGGMCYTIYLYHGTVAAALMPVTARVHAGSSYSVNCVIQVLFMMAVTIAIGAALFVLLEKPFMRRDWTTRVLRLVTGRPGTRIEPDAPVPGLPATDHTVARSSSTT